MVRFTLAAISLGAAAILAGCTSSASGPAPIGPAIWLVNAGASQSAEALQSLNFYPQSISVNAGDTVQWNYPTGEPHTVTLLGPRATVAAPNDPTNAAPAGPTTYDGTTYVSSGFLLLGKSYRMTFLKAGSYQYYCLIHPGMQGTVNVLAAGSAHLTDQATYTSAGAAQSATDLTIAAASVSTFPFVTGGPHLVAGISPGMNMGHPSSLTVMRFLDGPALSNTAVTIAAGQIVTWTNASNNSPHTVTIAPVGATFPTLSPFSPPSGGNVYDGTMLVNSGVLAPGASFSLQFTKPGTYTYHCIFHDDTEHMIGTVTVQ